MCRAGRTAQSHCHQGSLTPAPALCGDLVDSGHWSCWGGLACPQPPHVAWCWFLITPVMALSLSPSPLQFCACRCSFPSFEQRCVVLHFLLVFFLTWYLEALLA